MFISVFLLNYKVERKFSFTFGTLKRKVVKMLLAIFSLQFPFLLLLFFFLYFFVIQYLRLRDCLYFLSYTFWILANILYYLAAKIFT